MNRGVIYFAQGKKYLDEAVISAKSFKKLHKDIPVCLFTTEKNYRNTGFDEIKYLEPEDHPFKCKIKAILSTPYTENLYLDTDTLIKTPLYELFDFLQFYDLGIANVMKFKWRVDGIKLKDPLFDGFIDENQLNTGVVLFKKSERIQPLFKEWQDELESYDVAKYQRTGLSDQTVLSYLLLKEKKHEALGINFLNLPNQQYNARPLIFSEMKKLGREKEVKIIHTHGIGATFLQKVQHKIQVLFRK